MSNGVICFQIDVLIFNGLPEPFDKDVVRPAASDVHAYRYASASKKATKPLKSLSEFIVPTLIDKNLLFVR